MLKPYLIMAASAICTFLLLYACAPGHAEGWDTESNDLASWFATQTVKYCCDRRDAYLADDFESDPDGNYVAIITDGSANPLYDKPAIPNGTRIVVPKTAIRTVPPAPGHGVIFLQKNRPEGVPIEKSYVFCYFPPGGV